VNSAWLCTSRWKADRTPFAIAKACAKKLTEKRVKLIAISNGQETLAGVRTGTAKPRWQSAASSSVRRKFVRAQIRLATNARPQNHRTRDGEKTSAGFILF